MAYFLHHTIDFLNPLNEALHIQLYKKDVVPGAVTTLLGNSFSVNYPTGEGDKFDTIITSEAKLSITLYPDNVEEFDDFIVTFPDEWKIIAYDDSQIVFVGFLTPGEGRAGFQDKPHDISLTAVDGIGLLKGTPLTKDNGDVFSGVNLIIDYVLAILNKTGLELNLRLFSNIVESSMQDRTQDTQADTFNQTGLHCRTFLKSPTTFYDCYTCLERLLAEYFCVYQWNGKWVILRIGELQENVGAKIWHTEYNSAGAIVNVDQNLYDPSGVGRDRLIHPVEVGQSIGSNFAIKSSRYTYNYSPWPEIPANNKFDKGTEIPGATGDVYETDENGDDTATVIGVYQDYTIPEWTVGTFNNPPLLPPIDTAWRRSSRNIFGAEVNREILISKSTTNTQVLESEGLPVYVGDKVSISFDYKLSFNFNAQLIIAVANVYIVPNSGGAYYWWRDGATVTNRWRRNAFTVESIFLEYVDSSDHTKIYKSVNLDSQPIPVDGTLYIQLMNVMDSGLPNQAYFRNFSFSYYPFIAGGYLQLKADYAQTSQSANYKDTIDEDAYISDSPKKMLQGALYRANLTDLTTATWHRYSVAENRYFKEIGELARFNSSYRRMWKIDGQFDGLKFTPSNNPTVMEPLSFHKQFYFPDSAKLNGHYFVLVPPLTLNYSEGRADMNFIEVLQDGSVDGNSFGDSHIPLQYIFE
jgi:hypothetical protein